VRREKERFFLPFLDIFLLTSSSSVLCFISAVLFRFLCFTLSREKKAVESLSLFCV